jgi:hypothetical protein
LSGYRPPYLARGNMLVRPNAQPVPARPAHPLQPISNDMHRCNPNNPILLPKVNEEEDGEWNVKGKPAWSPCREWKTEKPLKPLIRCICGEWSGIGLHHVYADGRVMASYFHADANQLAAMGEAGKRFSAGCGWHVFLKLLDYDQGEFPKDK